MVSSHRSLVAAAAILALNQTGCAVLLAERAKSENPQVVPECSAGRGGVFIDGMFTALYGLGGLVGTGEEPAIGIPVLLLGAVHLASAISGSRAASKCKRLRAEHTEWIEQEQLRLTQSGGSGGPSAADGAAITPEAMPGAAEFPQPVTDPNAGAAGAADAGGLVAPGYGEPSGTAGTSGTTSADTRQPAARPAQPVRPAQPAQPARPPAADKPTNKPKDRPKGRSCDDFWCEEP